MTAGRAKLATFTAVGAFVVCGQSFAPAAYSRSHDKTPVINCVTHHHGDFGLDLRVRPKQCEFYNYSLPPTVTVKSMKWKHWGHDKAVGHGAATVTDPDARTYRGRVVVRIHRLTRNACPDLYYASARALMLSGSAQGHTERISLATCHLA
jgi:hypothetical protein